MGSRSIIKMVLLDGSLVETSLPDLVIGAQILWRRGRPRGERSEVPKNQAGARAWPAFGRRPAIDPRAAVVQEPPR